MSFLGRAFSFVTDVLMKVVPLDKKQKQAYDFYRSGMKAQGKGMTQYALHCYFESLKLEESPDDRSHTLYNIAEIYRNIGKNTLALEFFHQAVSSNPELAKGYNAIGVIYHSQATRIILAGDESKYELAEQFYDQAAEYLIKAVNLAPDDYLAARNWLLSTKRAILTSEGDLFVPFSYISKGYF